MSYLSPLRLHFAGQFLAAPSTVNNDPTHYDNATFKPSYQKRGAGATNGWWNPSGDAAFRFIGCRVTSAFGPDGAPVAHDRVLACVVADSDRRAPAKMADLDSEQQLVSELWGLEVRICTHDGATLLRGRYDVAAFMDIWDKWLSGKGDGLAGAMYQSVLTGLEWGDVDASPFLSALRAAAGEGEHAMLSIKFNVDMYDMDYTSPTFTMGRVAGTIGPAAADEPRHFVAGRQLMPYAVPSPPAHFFQPAGGINACVGVVDAERGKVLLDLGNALPLAPAGGGQTNLGPLTLAVLVPGAEGGGVAAVPLGSIAYTDDGWYERTAGVVEVPDTGALTAEQLAAVAEHPLALTLQLVGTMPLVAVAEPPSGAFVRADRIVCRLDAGESATVRLFATRFGRRLAGAEVLALLDPSGLQGGPGLPPVGTPTDVLTFPASVTTDASGMAELPVSAGDPGNPRGYIDGQLYGIRPVLKEVAQDPTYPFSPWHFASVLVWDAWKGDDPPTWYGSMQPVFQQYANLYPVMARFLDLADYASICANRNLLLLAFGADPGDPNYMPATRELSQARRSAILRWLSEVGDDGNPLLGTPPAHALAASGAVADAVHEGIPATRAPSRAALPPEGPPAGPGAPGKLSAARRRLMHQR
jgi:hypothetical protein